jgi:hypothetical protein
MSKTGWGGHDVPRLSSISRCLGPTHFRTPLHHLSGEATSTARANRAHYGI